MDVAWSKMFVDRDNCKNCYRGDMQIKSVVCDLHIEQGRKLIEMGKELSIKQSGTIDV